jgi:outer membrane protein OmpA-like peptidoglycan-associated protein
MTRDRSAIIPAARSMEATPGARPASPVVRRKTLVTGPDDDFEREADVTADRIMRMAAAPRGASHAAPVNTIRRSCATCAPSAPCAACSDEQLARAGRVAAGAPSPESVDAAVRVTEGGGAPLDQATRDFFEPRFGHDFRRVKIHADGESSAAAHALGARAYTHRAHIVFGASEYAPQTARGRRLLAHELAHVVQNGATDRIMRDVTGKAASAEVECPEHPPDRTEEIRTSRTSPGAIAFERDPLTLSLHNFGIDRAAPKAEHRTAVTELAALLNAHGRAEVRMHLVGHTDCTGSALHNDRLSQRRAREVRDALAPLLTRRVGITWASEFHPVASNATAEGRSRNRRVDVRFRTVTPPQPPPGTRPPPGTTPPIIDPPGGERPPEGARPPPIIDPPPGGGPTPDDHRDDDDGPAMPNLCILAPGLCAGVGLPFLLPLICLIEPALCVLPILPPILPPPPPPGGPDRPDRPDRPDHDRPHVMFVPDVRASNTPAGMNDRVSIAAPVHISAVVSNPPPAPQTILIEVDGGGPRTGEATVNGAPRINIAGTTALEVQGSTMTPPDSGPPRLQLGAWFAGDLVGASNTFAVSVIQQDWSTAYEDEIGDPTGYLMYVEMRWDHDGTAVRDLTGSHYVELVGVESETGAMRGLGVGRVQDPDDYALAEIMPWGDRHGIERRWLSGRGTQVLNQLWRTRDTRSGSSWVPSRNSGFVIERRYERDPDRPRCWRYSIEKAGRAVTIGGLSTGAGSGRASTM